MVVWVLLGAQLVADLPQENLPPPDLGLVFDILGREHVYNAHDATTLLGLGEDHFRWNVYGLEKVNQSRMILLSITCPMYCPPGNSMKRHCSTRASRLLLRG
jgi:hypothetical protein